MAGTQGSQGSRSQGSQMTDPVCGMKVDEKGDLFATGPKGIWVWDPQGHHLGTVVLPEQPANLNWGDNDYGTLYITATTSVYRLKTKVRGFVPYLQGTHH